MQAPHWVETMLNFSNKFFATQKWLLILEKTIIWLIPIIRHKQIFSNFLFGSKTATESLGPKNCFLFWLWFLSILEILAAEIADGCLF